MSVQQGDAERRPLVSEARISAISSSSPTCTMENKAELASTLRARKALTGAIVFCFLFMMVEFAGGFITNSLALLNDAVHMITDVANLSLSLLALHASSWDSSEKYTYGWRRAEVVGALASVFTTWALVVWIMVEAISRMVTIVQCADGSKNEGCFAIDSPVMLYIAVGGFCANVVCALILNWGGHHGHSHGALGGGGHGHSCSHHETISDDTNDHDHGHDDHGHAHDDHGHAHDDHGHAHDDHGHAHDDHGHAHDDHGHAHDDHGHAHDDHGHAHDDHGHAQDDHGHAHDDHGHAHDDHGRDGGGNMNLRGALLHVIGDCLQSLGVVIAAGTIWYFNNKYHGSPKSERSYYNIADPCCSMLFGVITLFTTINLAKDIFAVLMECTPKGIAHGDVSKALADIEDVRAVDDLHIWSLGSEGAVMSAHLLVRSGLTSERAKLVRTRARKVCRKAGIDHTTIQINTEDD
jgi:zinc transporter 2